MIDEACGNAGMEQPGPRVPPNSLAGGVAPDGWGRRPVVPGNNCPGEGWPGKAIKVLAPGEEMGDKAPPRSWRDAEAGGWRRRTAHRRSDAALSRNSSFPVQIETEPVR